MLFDAGVRVKLADETQHAFVGLDRFHILFPDVSVGVGQLPQKGFILFAGLPLALKKFLQALPESRHLLDPFRRPRLGAAGVVSNSPPQLLVPLAAQLQAFSLLHALNISFKV